MKLYPAIDIKGGVCVRLCRGDFNDETVYSQSPADIAAKWEASGASFIHVVDLDGAKDGTLVNEKAIREIVERVSIPIELGGGVRSEEDAAHILELGVSRVIIGTKAVEEPELVKRLVDRFGAERIVVGIDAHNGKVAVKGWEVVSEVPALELALSMKEKGVKTIIYTDISKDGMLCGPNVKETVSLAGGSGLEIIASGGVSGMKDLEELAEAGVEGAIIGKALYEERIDLKAAVNRFERTEKKLIAYINAENDVPGSVKKAAAAYEQSGADALFVYNHAADEKEKYMFFDVVKDIVAQLDIPVYIGCTVDNFDDVKHAYYTGAQAVVIAPESLNNEKPVTEAIKRFGRKHVFLEKDLSAPNAFENMEDWEKYDAGGYVFKHVTAGPLLKTLLLTVKKPVIIRDSLQRNDLSELVSIDGICAVATNALLGKSFIKAKRSLLVPGVSFNMFESSMDFDSFKKDAAGLVPVVTTDYISGDVLMVAYMNKEAYEKTVETGIMTYFSRSRQSLWVKGETSGHFQYVKELKIDCDKDTILARVKQIGAACHTGERSCFYRTLVKRNITKEDDGKILDEVYDTIADRKIHPKEGSYTNYLFSKGLDKILKKCGEEATEITIAAKNGDKEELIYEIGDYLYHLSVLMAEKDVTWDDVRTELKNRH